MDPQRPPTATDGASPRRAPALARWRLSPAAGAIVLVVIAVVEYWATRAADPDFWFPDPFRGLVFYLAALFVVSGWLPWDWVRFNVRLVLGLVPVVFFVGADAWFRYRPVDRSNQRIERTPGDALLRYHYRPGADTFEKDRRGQPLHMTKDGLWDEEHAVEKPAGTYRVIILGDSVPNDPSIPFAERFPRVLESKLREAAGGRNVEVINVSCEGYNSTQEVRLLERVGLKYDPDLVVLAYVLNDPFLQNGGYRRVGNSFALFQFAPLALKLLHQNSCSLFRRFHEGYAFDLVVRESMERLKLLADLHHFQAAVVLLPLIEPFNDPDCGFAYDRASEAARSSGLPLLRIVDELAGEDHHQYLKPRDPSDVTHPNARGHARIAESMARFLRRWVAPATAQPL